MKQKIICVHIGARAHYLIPKALESQGNLAALITDTWVSSAIVRSIISKLPLRILKSFSGRYSSSLPIERIYSFSLRFLLVELYIRLRFKDHWEQLLARNFFFEKIASGIFKNLPSNNSVLGISYTSLTVFEIARVRAQKTILFQIDPALKEEKIVADLVNRYGDKFKTSWQKAPEKYWSDWRKECDLSNVIMVNSEWSKLALTEEGIPNEKIKVLALPFPIENDHLQFKRSFSENFSTDRPMRLLFLGTLTLRKGIHLVLEAAGKLAEFPIEFILVGHNELDESILNLPNVKYKGVASRSETNEHYKHADAFLFPTLSDGFGLTQLEAMAWQLPVIASKCCGEVVIDDLNGIVLPECNTNALIEAILKLFKQPDYLKKLSGRGLETVEKFSINRFAEGLINLN